MKTRDSCRFCIVCEYVVLKFGVSAYIFIANLHWTFEMGLSVMEGTALYRERDFFSLKYIDNSITIYNSYMKETKI